METSSPPRRSVDKTWGLVLSGGAAYGLANAGVLEVLDAEGLRPDFIAGSSMGAIIAALYAMGIEVKELRALAKKIRLWDIATLSRAPFKRGLHDGALQQNLHTLLSPILGEARIKDCRIPFICIAGKVRSPVDWSKVLEPNFTDYVKQHVEPAVFDPETKILDALMATSAIPVVFAPVKIGEETYVDLVHFGAIPARTLRSHCNPDVVIATDTNPRYRVLQRFLPRPWREFLQDGHASLDESRSVCDLVIEPKAPARPYRFDKAEEFMNAGRKATLQNLPRIRELLM